MKQLLMLLLAAGAFTTTFAQSRYDHNNANDAIAGRQYENRRYNHGDQRYNDYAFDRRERDARIQGINRSYSARIYDVRTNRWMRNSEKRRAIRQLEAERTAAIRQVMDRYNNRNIYDNDRYARRSNSRY